MNTMTAPKVYTIEEVAEHLKVNPRTVNRLLERGELKGKKVGRLWRVTDEALQSYLRSETAETTE